jgi:hypothetical protein
MKRKNILESVTSPKPWGSRIIKVRAETSKTEDRKTQRKSPNAKSWIFEKVYDSDKTLFHKIV